MSEQKGVRKLFVLIDPQTGKTIYTPAEQMRRKIQQAVIIEDRLNDGAPPYPAFLDEKSKNEFLSMTADLIARFMTDRFTYEELVSELKTDVEKSEAKKRRELKSLGLPERTIHKEISKTKKCLTRKQNRLPEPLNMLCNPNSSGWRKEENKLISKLLLVYQEFSPLTKNLRIYDNLAMIFIACGLRPGMRQSDYETLSETLRRRRIRPAQPL